MSSFDLRVARIRVDGLVLRRTLMCRDSSALVVCIVMVGATCL